MEIYIDTISNDENVIYYLKEHIDLTSNNFSQQIINYVNKKHSIINKYKSGKQREHAIKDQDPLYRNLTHIFSEYYLCDNCNLDTLYKQCDSTILSCHEFYGDTYIGYQVSGLSMDEIDKIDKSELKTICKTLLNDENIQFKFYGFTTR